MSSAPPLPPFGGALPLDVSALVLGSEVEAFWGDQPKWHRGIVYTKPTADAVGVLFPSLQTQALVPLGSVRACPDLLSPVNSTVTSPTSASRSIEISSSRNSSPSRLLELNLVGKHPKGLFATASRAWSSFSRTRSPSPAVTRSKPSSSSLRTRSPSPAVGKAASSSTSLPSASSSSGSSSASSASTASSSASTPLPVPFFPLREALLTMPSCDALPPDNDDPPSPYSAPSWNSNGGEPPSLTLGGDGKYDDAMYDDDNPGQPIPPLEKDVFELPVRVVSQASDVSIASTNVANPSPATQFSPPTVVPPELPQPKSLESTAPTTLSSPASNIPESSTKTSAPVLRKLSPAPLRGPAAAPRGAAQTPATLKPNSNIANLIAQLTSKEAVEPPTLQTTSSVSKDPSPANSRDPSPAPCTSVALPKSFPLMMNIFAPGSQPSQPGTPIADALKPVFGSGTTASSSTAPTNPPSLEKELPDVSASKSVSDKSDVGDKRGSVTLLPTIVVPTLRTQAPVSLSIPHTAVVHELPPPLTIPPNPKATPENVSSSTPLLEASESDSDAQNDAPGDLPEIPHMTTSSPSVSRPRTATSVSYHTQIGHTPPAPVLATNSSSVPASYRARADTIAPQRPRGATQSLTPPVASSLPKSSPASVATPSSLVVPVFSMPSTSTPRRRSATIPTPNSLSPNPPVRARWRDLFSSPSNSESDKSSKKVSLWKLLRPTAHSPGSFALPEASPGSASSHSLSSAPIPQISAPLSTPHVSVPLSSSSYVSAKPFKSLPDHPDDIPHTVISPSCSPAGSSLFSSSFVSPSSNSFDPLSSGLISSPPLPVLMSSSTSRPCNPLNSSACAASRSTASNSKPLSLPVTSSSRTPKIQFRSSGQSFPRSLSTTAPSSPALGHQPQQRQLSESRPSPQTIGEPKSPPEARMIHSSMHGPSPVARRAVSLSPLRGSAPKNSSLNRSLSLESHTSPSQRVPAAFPSQSYDVLTPAASGLREANRHDSVSTEDGDFRPRPFLQSPMQRGRSPALRPRPQQNQERQQTLEPSLEQQRHQQQHRLGTPQGEAPQDSDADFLVPTRSRAVALTENGRGLEQPPQRTTVSPAASPHIHLPPQQRQHANIPKSSQRGIPLPSPPQVLSPTSKSRTQPSIRATPQRVGPASHPTRPLFSSSAGKRATPQNSHISMHLPDSHQSLLQAGARLVVECPDPGAHLQHWETVSSAEASKTSRSKPTYVDRGVGTHPDFQSVSLDQNEASESSVPIKPQVISSSGFHVRANGQEYSSPQHFRRTSYSDDDDGSAPSNFFANSSFKASSPRFNSPSQLQPTVQLHFADDSLSPLPKSHISSRTNASPFAFLSDTPEHTASLSAIPSSAEEYHRWWMETHLLEGEPLGHLFVVPKVSPCNANSKFSH